MGINELIFCVQTIFVSGAVLGALWLGKEALVAFVCLVCVLANLFVLKQVPLFGFNATCADAFAIGATLGLNVLQEYFGQAITRKTILINFCILFFYVIMSQIHLAYLPSAADVTQAHFEALLAFMPRLALSSLVVYGICQSIDALLFGYFKRLTNGRFLVLRNYGSLCISQLCDTVLFSFLGLYGIVDSMFEIIVVSYGIKICAIALSSPFIALSRRVVNRQIEI
jgi:uncharacterized integral membrane protein (TIGR00697 family)